MISLILQEYIFICIAIAMFDRLSLFDISALQIIMYIPIDYKKLTKYFD